MPKKKPDAKQPAGADNAPPAAKKRPTKGDMAVKKELAKSLYVQEKLEQKVIALRVGVSEKTIGKWAADNHWDKARRTLLISKDALLNSYLDHLEDLNRAIAEREEGKRFATTHEADIIVKYTAAIRSMETDLCIADLVGAGTRFIKFAQNLVASEQINEIINLWDSFILNAIKNK
jgi:hypothetical protein